MRNFFPFATRPIRLFAGTFLLIAFSMVAKSQQTQTFMRIHLSNNQVVDYPVSGVDSVTYFSTIISPTFTLIADKKWFVEKSEYIGNGQTETSTPEACDADNYNIFISNGNVISSIGTILCQGEAATGESTSGKWNLSSDNKTFTFTENNCADNCTQVYTIESITDTKLVLSMVQSEMVNGQTITYTIKIYLRS